MARAVMARVGVPAVYFSVARAAPALCNRSSVMFAPASRFSGRALNSTNLRQAVSSRTWQGVQVRARSTAQEEKVAVGDDIIDKINHDHRELEHFFQKYKDSHKQGDDMEARKWFNQFVWEVSRHAVCEELIFYPMLTNMGEEGKKMADEAIEYHHKTKEILADLQTTLDMDEFDRKMDKMWADLKEHMNTEESEDLPFLRDNTDVSSRENAGKTFALGKNLVPTHPHPAVPERPVALEAAVGLLITPLDKLRDIFTPFPSQNKSVN